MTEPAPLPEAAAPDPTPPAPTSCRTCRQPVARTVLGWMHVDHLGAATTWLCAEHLALAEPDLLSPEAGTLPGSRRRPTPIPRRHGVAEADPSASADWPAPSVDRPWWELPA
ncbi:MAG: hypothetical protein GEU94_20300 [Micromonosporaceae bacterium]|nr:hypothetical protein [Micromonosporaceae bacterium]